MKTYKTLKAYMADQSDEGRAALVRLQEVLHAAIPGADDGIAWSMPAIKVGGKAILCYAAFKDHYSLFPMGTTIFDTVDGLEKYRAGKGTIRFEYGVRLPVTIVKKVAKERLREVEAKAGKRKAG